MSFNLQSILENDLILLRPLVDEDYESLYKAAEEPLIWQQHPNNRHEQNEFKIFFADSLASKGALVVIDKVSREVIGSSRYVMIHNSNNAVEIGWSFLSRKYWGGKFNKEVKQLMINYAFEHVDNIVFYIDKNNIRSQKAVEKINGRRIFESKYQDLIKTNSIDFTYLIDKKNWKF